MRVICWKESSMARVRRSSGTSVLASIATCCVIALLAANAAAQTATGGLRGFVKDETGAVLVGVTIEASSPVRIGGAAVDVTDAQGLYRFENLPPGDYTLVFSLSGFSTIRREGIRVEVGRTIQLDAAMKVGAVEQSI